MMRSNRHFAAAAAHKSHARARRTRAARGTRERAVCEYDAATHAVLALLGCRLGLRGCCLSAAHALL
eukprot:5065696-Lingulodinium_polyedra.AAC.1